MVRIASIGLCWSALLLIPSLAAAQARLPTALQQQFEALMAEKAARGPAERKVHSQLLWAARATRGQPGVRGFRNWRTGCAPTRVAASC